ncbi:molybdopterin-dependent oxidoreductase [Jannaschia sp. M317]|uniref:molybdopterin-dependent oxidoreductase n=1 Tax=Jannaschia sp. M317 TaxID=2867011 RepID=UPI0021A6C0D5|nr:molybdopterin-dependent oxidoreductase [Jannaschia sp. M317]UWQ16403.1 molybdopterin-dependent oxidoreductase [Jannaschia sp. M317]
MPRAVFHAMAFVAISAVPVWANDLAAPEGDVILTVTGLVDVVNVDQSAVFDLAMLEALDSSVIETSTIWTEGENVFQGVSLAILAERLGLDGTTLKATAINDYTVEIPLSDAVEGGPIIAYRMDGNTMSVRDKGPLWVIYPYDSTSEYRSEVIYSRSIWQLDRIEAVE